MNRTGLVTDIDQFSTHDGPGIRTTIFLQGCPLRCQWCHSPETQPGAAVPLYQRAKCICCGSCIAVCPKNAIVPNTGKAPEDEPQGIFIDRKSCDNCLLCTTACSTHALKSSSIMRTTQEIMAILLENRPFFINSGGGVTVTGGELLMQPAFVQDLLASCRREGIHTVIETSGYGSFSHLSAIEEYTDLIFYDIKHMNEEVHQKYIGTGKSVIQENLKRLCSNRETAKKIVVRIPCIPGVNDDEDNIGCTADFVAGLGIGYLELLPYNGAAASKYQWLQKEYLLEGLEPREKEYYQSMEQVVHRRNLLTRWT